MHDFCGNLATIKLICLPHYLEYTNRNICKQHLIMKDYLCNESTLHGMSRVVNDKNRIIRRQVLNIKFLINIGAVQNTFSGFSNHYWTITPECLVQLRFTAGMLLYHYNANFHINLIQSMNMQLEPPHTSKYERQVCLSHILMYGVGNYRIVVLCHLSIHGDVNNSLLCCFSIGLSFETVVPGLYFLTAVSDGFLTTWLLAFINQAIY